MENHPFVYLRSVSEVISQATEVIVIGTSIQVIDMLFEAGLKVIAEIVPVTTGMGEMAAKSMEWGKWRPSQWNGDKS
jgi:hypothetical protein